MRTLIKANTINRVFGYRQDRGAVSGLIDVCIRASRHLTCSHVTTPAERLVRAFKRGLSPLTAGKPGLMAHLRLNMPWRQPCWQPVRLESPASARI
jgi:hypothetical protein